MTRILPDESASGARTHSGGAARGAPSHGGGRAARCSRIWTSDLRCSAQRRRITRTAEIRGTWNLSARPACRLSVVGDEGRRRDYHGGHARHRGARWLRRVAQGMGRENVNSPAAAGIRKPIAGDPARVMRLL